MNAPELLLGAAVGAGMTTLGAAAFSFVRAYRTQHAAGSVSAGPDPQIVDRLREDLAALSASLDPHVRHARRRRAR